MRGSRAVGWTLGGVVIVAASAVATAQKDARVAPNEASALAAVVDAVAAGGAPGGDAWLQWTGHFLRSGDGNVYVPFTLSIAEAPREFGDVNLYVRVARRGAGPGTGQSKGTDIVGFQPGQIPVSVPERQFVPEGVPTPGENAAALALLDRQRAQTGKHPFERYEPIAAKELRGASIQRAFLVPPGDYDVYVAIRERAGAAPFDVAQGRPKWAVLKRALTVPAFPAGRLSASSVILADRIDAMPAPLTGGDQQRRPYALGAAEIVPAADSTLSSDETLTVAFLVYNPGLDAGGRPRITVDYRFFRAASFDPTPFVETQPQQLDSTTLPATLDLKRERQLAVTQSVPLITFTPGAYRLEIVIQDQISSERLTLPLEFRIK
jgi:hypothetical protein